MTVEALVPADHRDLRPRRGDNRSGRTAHLRMRRADLAPGGARAWSCCRRPPSRSRRWSRACARAGVPFVARGAGTGLSGGALPRTDGRADRHLADAPDHRDRPGSQRAIVEPGVTNLEVSRPRRARTATSTRPTRPASWSARSAATWPRTPAARTASSTASPCTTSPGCRSSPRHGELTWLGDGTGTAPATTWSARSSAREGTLGIVTKIAVRLTRDPAGGHARCSPPSRTTDAGGAAVSAIIGAGILPAAIEMMDALAIEAAEAAWPADYPDGAGAVLMVELDGPAADVAPGRGGGAGAVRAGRRVRDPGGGRPGRAGRDLDGPQVRVRRRGPDQPGLHRAGRRRATHRAGRGAGRDRRAVPASPASGWPTSSTPATATCTRWCSTTTPCRARRRRPRSCPARSSTCASQHGGSITGEHGVGVGQVQYMPKMFGADDLDTMQLLRCAFDPAGLCNPGKIFPTPRLCGEVPGPRRGLHPLVAAGQAELF